MNPYISRNKTLLAIVNLNNTRELVVNQAYKIALYKNCIDLAFMEMFY